MPPRTPRDGGFQSPPGVRHGGGALTCGELDFGADPATADGGPPPGILGCGSPGEPARGGEAAEGEVVGGQAEQGVGAGAGGVEAVGVARGGGCRAGDDGCRAGGDGGGTGSGRRAGSGTAGGFRAGARTGSGCRAGGAFRAEVSPRSGCRPDSRTKGTSRAEISTGPEEGGFREGLTVERAGLAVATQLPPVRRQGAGGEGGRDRVAVVPESAEERGRGGVPALGAEDDRGEQPFPRAAGPAHDGGIGQRIAPERGGPQGGFVHPSFLLGGTDKKHDRTTAARPLEGRE